MYALNPICSGAFFCTWFGRSHIIISFPKSIYIYICIYTYMYVHVYIHLCVYVCISIYIYIYGHRQIYLWQLPLASGPGPCGPRSCGPGPYGPPWALMGWALMGRARMGWALMGRALMAPVGLFWLLSPGPLVQSNSCLIHYINIHIHIYVYTHMYVYLCICICNTYYVFDAFSFGSWKGIHGASSPTFKAEIQALLTDECHLRVYFRRWFQR